VVSVVIPAHNEAAGIGRLLQALAADSSSALDVVVVCNGCTDDTAAAAAEFRDVRVVELAEASKQAALAEGDRQARCQVRAYVDADVTIDQPDLLGLVRAVSDGGVLAAAPGRVLDRRGVPLLVSWYYDVWERLPQVEAGLFGRGVVVVSGEGYERLRSVPPVLSDDLAMSEVFAPDERRVVEGSQVSIRLPRTVPDLVRRRIRVATGVVEVDRLKLRDAASRTSPRVLLSVLPASPMMPAKVAVFVVVTLVARWQASKRVKAGDFHTWLRDGSSRAG
jgi:hypothetical protein